jgi:hypothetical protein
MLMFLKKQEKYKIQIIDSTEFNKPNQFNNMI